MSGIDSALPSVAPVAPMEGFRAVPLGTMPPLAWMATVGCIGDLAINRILLRTWADTLPRDAFLQLDRWGAFSRNLAAVSALVALGFCLWAFGSRRSGLPLSARVGIMGFGWALLPIITGMTFLPLAWTRVELVIVTVGLAHALILLLILAGIHWRSARPVSASLALLLVSYVSGVLSLAVDLLGGRALWEHTERLAFAFRWSGELAFLAVPIALVFSMRISWRTVRGKLRVVMSGLAAAGFAIGLILWRNAVGGDLANLFYGAFRLDFLAEHDALGWYAVPLGIGWAVSTSGILSRDPKSRQLAAALIVLLCTGYAPRTPSALVMSVFAVALISRVALALAWERREASLAPDS